MATTDKSELLQGTLDMMILKVLATAGSSGQHGYGIVRRIQHVSEDVLRVEEGSLYPALHRLQKRGFLDSYWHKSETNRRARYYRLTPRGRTQLKTEAAEWSSVSAAIDKVMNARNESLVSDL